MPTDTLTLISVLSLSTGALCAAWIVHDVIRHPAKMAIMNFVWPISALFGSVLLLWFYLKHGRETSGDTRHDPPFSIAVAKGALHCGAGCTLGDIIAETLALALPGVLLLFGYPHLFEERIFAVWGLDYVFALGIGIVFQYFAIAPMRDLGLREGLWVAFKADVLSLSAWQVGMYGAMAIAHFVIFPSLDTKLDAASPSFWFAMQLAMLAGFATAYPVNWWLIRSGVKERM
ncbi:DUF4396 domain-containing protein [Aquicoccus sp. G2-2]|uniref:DUF4396 domain-containing protein n=1 Tax=Aquicoccus sp. G2-2 TaxID=3092120 RepID=UPI002ADF53D9|nr:DUF4396 domain-containing protein [Aquicoccus sp. G2-2]MEA1115236.1 DUF4396 domain-containing protein [Aquicoccus sp. G2-2]